MKTGQADIDIKATPEDVWAVIGEFGGMHEWMPGIDSCEVVGDDRLIGAGGMVITEHLVARDEARRQITYSVVAGVPIEHHQATITVTPAGDVTHVTWVVETIPDEMNELMVNAYGRALDALKAKVES